MGAFGVSARGSGAAAQHRDRGHGHHHREGRQQHAARYVGREPSARVGTRHSGAAEQQAGAPADAAALACGRTPANEVTPTTNSDIAIACFASTPAT